MFWKHNNANSNYIETLLNKVDVSLQDLMEEDDILQECKGQNKKLIEFLVRPEIMEQLVTLITVEPSVDIDERNRFKYPNIACELLTCDIVALNERLAADELLDKLYSFLEGEPPLNPLLASFFSKTLGILIARRSEQNWYSYQITCLKVLEFLKSKENCIGLLLNHLGTSAIMDLMLKLMTQVEGAEMQQNLFSWLESQQFIPSLIALLSPEVDSERHCNVSHLLCDVLRKSRENINATDSDTPSDLITILESPKTVSLLLDCILNGEKNESSIVGGIDVLLTLIEPARTRPGGPETMMYSTMAGLGTTECTSAKTDGEDASPVVQSTVAAILPRLKDLHDILLNPPKKPAVKTTVGTLDPPLGKTRLQVAKLLAALVATNNSAVNQELANLGTVEVLLDLFFKYQWNNFLHTQVEQFLAFAFNKQTASSEVGDGEPPSLILIENILVKCQLLQRIMDAWEDNESNEGKEGNQRRGYMGHLIMIANHIRLYFENGTNNDLLKEKVPVETLTAWEEFVTDKLAKVNIAHNIALGGTRPNQSVGSDKEEANYKNMPYPTDASIHQAFTDYQLQEMAPPFIEMYGYHDNDFNDVEDTLHSSVDRLPGSTFGLNDDEEDLDRQAELFKNICAKKVHSLEDAEENAWEDTNQLGSYRAPDHSSRRWENVKDGPENSSSDEEEEDGDATIKETFRVECVRGPKEGFMDVDTSEIVWPCKTSTISTAADFSNPWVSGDSVPSQESAFGSSDGGWADFSSFETNFSASTQLDDGNQSCGNPSESAVTEGAAVPVTPFSFEAMGDADPAEASPANDSTSILSETARLGESDANANPTNRVEDVTPTATAIIEEVASAAVAAVSAVVADKLELDNQRFLEDVNLDVGKGDAASTVSDTEPAPEQDQPSCAQEITDKRETGNSPGEEVFSEST